MTTTRRKVLFAIPALDTGGPDRVFFEILTALDRERFAPHLMLSAGTGRYLSRLPADVPVEVLGTERGLRGRYPVLQALRCVRRIAPDVVIATLRMQLTLGAIAPAFPSHTRLVVRPATPHSQDFAALEQGSLLKHRIARGIAVSTLRRATAIVCQSEAMKADLETVVRRPERLHVIGNPIDVAAVQRASFARQVRLPGSPALVSVGRFWPVKGYDILLRALPAVRARFPELHLTIFGQGPDREQLEQLTARLDLTRSVTFAGFTPEPMPAVRGADLFVLASRYEGFPNAALEALACGTPVVLTSCEGANAQVVRPGINGRLANEAEPAAFARALETAITEARSYDRAAIVADTEERFGARRIVRGYERVLELAARG